jgi:hypothetical protein
VKITTAASFVIMDMVSSSDIFRQTGEFANRWTITYKCTKAFRDHAIHRTDIYSASGNDARRRSEIKPSSK